MSVCLCVCVYVYIYIYMLFPFWENGSVFHNGFMPLPMHQPLTPEPPLEAAQCHRQHRHLCHLWTAQWIHSATNPVQDQCFTRKPIYVIIWLYMYVYPHIYESIYSNITVSVYETAQDTAPSQPSHSGWVRRHCPNIVEPSDLGPRQGHPGVVQKWLRRSSFHDPNVCDVLI